MGVRRVLYGLHLLRLVPWTIVAEGEKDVEALWALGLPATTNPDGAGPGKWRPAYTDQLIDAEIRHVFIIPDNDATGRDHAREVLRRCAERGLSTALITLPSLPPKGDVSDYLETGHGRRDLVSLLRRARRTS